jgi:toxin HigB-1
MPILIGYANGKLEKICLQTRAARKNLPQNVADLLPQRLSELAAFASLGSIPSGAPLHFHPLTANWAAHCAVSIDKRYRIIFRPAGDFETLEEGGLNLATVTEITIVSVEDYHG